jgi:hypothetical protein
MSPDSHKAELLVSRALFTEALKLLSTPATRRRARLGLSYAGSTLRLTSGSAEATIPAKGSWPADEVNVSGKRLLQLWDDLPNVDPVPLRVIDSRLYIDDLSLPCGARPIPNSPEVSATSGPDRDEVVLVKSPRDDQQQLSFDLQGVAEGNTSSRRALDDLFSLARQYRSSGGYASLLSFVSRFRFYAPYNALLVHIQMPGATYVAPARRWLESYGRRIRPEARPIVILQPRGPVM